MTVKSKPVRICTEGATTDGRTVQRSWLTDIEQNYDPNVYGARINIDHLNMSYMPRRGCRIGVYRRNQRRCPERQISPVCHAETH